MEKQLQAAATWLWHHKQAGASSVKALLSAKNEEQYAEIWSKICQKHELLLKFDHIVSQGEKVYEDYLSKGIRLIYAYSEDYPIKLYGVRNPIPILSVRGDTRLLCQRQIAIVGSRHATDAGLSLGTLSVHALMSRGFLITSGGALGIDAMAHREAMRLGQPTLVVTATDVTKMYPKENEDIFVYAGTHGAIVSQYPCMTPPKRELFPSRNALMAGLSDATCIVQCREQSGALYTAQASLSMNRPVFVVAISGFNSAHEGGLNLVKNQKACLVSSAEDFDCLGRGGQDATGVQMELGVQMLYPPQDGRPESMADFPISAKEPLNDCQIPIMISRKSAPLAPLGKGAGGKGPIVPKSAKPLVNKQKSDLCPYEDELMQAIYHALEHTCLGREEIARHVGCFDLSRLNEALFDMECDGVIVNLGGGYRLENGD